MSIALQNTIVGLVILGACGWMIYKLMRPKKGKRGACYGCSLSDTCAKKELVDKCSDKR